MANTIANNAILSDEELAAVLKLLTPKQRKFAEEYCVDLNGKQAALRAGYAASGADVTASRALRKTKVSKYIMHLKATQTLSTGVTAEEVVRELAKIAFLNPSDLFDYKDGELKLKDFAEIENPEVINQIKVRALMADGAKYGEVTEIKMQDKLRALELLGKHMALFTENLNLLSNGKDLPTPQNVTKLVINHRGKGEKINADVENG